MTMRQGPPGPRPVPPPRPGSTTWPPPGLRQELPPFTRREALGAFRGLMYGLGLMLALLALCFLLGFLLARIGVRPEMLGPPPAPMKPQRTTLRSEMGGAARLERATLCLEGRCSIRLSYAPAAFNSNPVADRPLSRPMVIALVLGIIGCVLNLVVLIREVRR